MTKLKFEGFTVGQRIRAEDFEPYPGRPECYVAGRIIEARPTGTADRGYAHYVIEVDRDVFGGEVVADKYSRVSATSGALTFVPMQLSGRDWDTRITVLEG